MSNHPNSATQRADRQPDLPSFMPAHNQRGARGRVAMVTPPKNFKASLGRLWSYIAPERGLLGVIVLLALVSVTAGLVLPWLIGQAVDAMTGGAGQVLFSVVFALLGVIAALYAADAVAHFSAGWLMAGVAQRLVRGMRAQLFARMQHIPLAYFDTHSHGDLMSRLTNDVDNISSTIAQSSTQLVSSLLLIAGALGMMLVLSPFLTLAAVVTIPLMLLMSRSIVKRTRDLFRRQQSVLGALNGHMEETISGIQLVQAFGRKEAVIDQFETMNRELCSVGTKAQIWSGLIMPMMNVINNFGFVCIAGLGAYLAIQNLVTVGLIASFVAYARQFGRPLNEVASIFNTLQTALAGAERVFELMDEVVEEADSTVLPQAAAIRGQVEFDKVTFSYTAGSPVLQDISFSVPAGSMVAIVGHTGAGKTTIVNLLSRFYEPDSGAILLDGRNVREYPRAFIRQAFGVVLQDSYLFSGTIMENIRYGRLEASDAEVMAAARNANAHDFIEKLPQAYQTELSESASTLSHGQKQLLAIARAMLSNAAMLILDEATSSVDTLTELHIQQALAQLMQGRTSFVIAHRLRTIRDADLILVMEHGRIVESGTHLSLLAAKGVYYRMYHPAA